MGLASRSRLATRWVVGAMAAILLAGGALPQQATAHGDPAIEIVEATNAAVTTAVATTAARPRNYAFAVIGDTPYSANQLAEFPALRREINRRKRVEFAVHVGDIKNGRSPCTDAYFDSIKSEFDQFSKPLLFTPGDNEWTDCHRFTAGAYDPLERLAKLRDVFFSNPTSSLGANPYTVESQGVLSQRAQVENQLWTQPGVVFASVHVVGSRNGTEPWFGDDPTGTKADDPGRRIAEVDDRTAAALEWLDHAFETADNNNARGVVIFHHANAFNLLGQPRFEHQGFVQRLNELAATFNRPVLLIEGDTHVYQIDRPLLNATPRARKLRRIVVEGTNVDEFLRVTVNFKRKNLFTVKRLSVPE